MYEVATHQFVYMNDDGTEQDVFKFTFKVIMGNRPSFPAHIPSEYVAIANGGWHKELGLRPSLSQIVQQLKALHGVTLCD